MTLGRLFTLGAIALAAFGGTYSAGQASAGQPPPGVFKTPFTVFRGRPPGLKVSISLAEERIGWDAHARVTCANGSSHWQLLIEGGRGGHVDSRGDFRFKEYEPAEPGEEDESSSQKRVTIEQIEEGLRYGTPAELRVIKGHVFANRVAGRIRYWGGPGRSPHSLHSKCGTGSADGRWVKFSVPRVNGPAQPGGHWPPRARTMDRRATASAAGPTVQTVKLPSGLGEVEEVIAYNRSQLLLASRFPPSLVRVNADGSLDRSFGDRGRAMAAGYGVTVLADGKILLADAGAPPGERSNRDGEVTRLLPNGHLDPTFGTGGRAFVDLGGRLDSAESTAVAPNGDILVGGARANVYSRGSDASPAIARLNPNGSVDRSFGDDGVRVLRPYTESGVYDIAPTPDGGVIGLTAAEEAFGDELWRLTAKGSIDRSFGKRGVVNLFVPSLRTGLGLLAEMKVLPGGRILLAGTGEQGGTQPRPNLAEATRLLPNGRIDRSYGHHGWAVKKIGSAYVEAMTTLPGGSLLLTASSLNSENGTSQLQALAFAGDGSLDRHFGRGGRLRVNLDGWSLAESVATLGRRAVVVGRVGRHGGSRLLALPPLRR